MEARERTEATSEQQQWRLGVMVIDTAIRDDSHRALLLLVNCTRTLQTLGIV